MRQRGRRRVRILLSWLQLWQAGLEVPGQVGVPELELEPEPEPYPGR